MKVLIFLLNKRISKTFSNFRLVSLDMICVTRMMLLVNSRVRLT